MTEDMSNASHRAVLNLGLIYMLVRCESFASFSQGLDPV